MQNVYKAIKTEIKKLSASALQSSIFISTLTQNGRIMCQYWIVKKSVRNIMARYCKMGKIEKLEKRK